MLHLRFELNSIGGNDPSVKTCRLSDLRNVMSDFVIVCGETEIPVHKNVLATHSKVFKAMLSHDCAETAEGKLYILEIFGGSTILVLHSFEWAHPNLKGIRIFQFLQAPRYRYKKIF